MIIHQVEGHEIKWYHLIMLYEKTQCKSGLYIGNKLKLDHMKLNSYSRMNVRLAAQVGGLLLMWTLHALSVLCVIQVLSKSVADAFSTVRALEPENQLWRETVETEKFCRMFDRFFDCLNTRNLDEAKFKRKPDLRAYFKPDDSRLKVSLLVYVSVIYITDCLGII